MAAGIGAEFRKNAAGTLLPVGQHAPGQRAEKHVAQQIAVVLPVEPADEQTLRLGIPGPGVPHLIQHIGGRGDGGHRLGQHRRRIHPVAHRRRRGWIPLAGEAEQIGAFGGRHRHG